MIIHLLSVQIKKSVSDSLYMPYKEWMKAKLLATLDGEFGVNIMLSKMPYTEKTLSGEERMCVVGDGGDFEYDDYHLTYLTNGDTKPERNTLSGTYWVYELRNKETYAHVCDYYVKK